MYHKEFAKLVGTMGLGLWVVTSAGCAAGDGEDVSMGRTGNTTNGGGVLTTGGNGSTVTGTTGAPATTTGNGTTATTASTTGSTSSTTASASTTSGASTTGGSATTGGATTGRTTGAAVTTGTTGVAATTGATSSGTTGIASSTTGIGMSIIPMFSEDFEDGDITNPSWIPLALSGTVTGTWSVVTDAAKTPGSKVLTQSQAGISDWVVAVSGDYRWTDQVITTKFKYTTASTSLGSVGVFARIVDAKNYYFFYIDSGTKLQLRAKAAGSSTTIAQLSLKAPLPTVAVNTWHTLTLSVVGQTLTGTLDGNAATSVTGPAPSPGIASGGIAVGTYDSATADFDDVTVTGPSAASGTTGGGSTTSGVTTGVGTTTSAGTTGATTGATTGTGATTAGGPGDGGAATAGD